MIPVCPKCDAALMIIHLRTVDVDVCPRCRGLWLDAGELEELAGPATGPATEDDPIARLRRDPGVAPPGPQRSLCPRCDRPMRQVVARPSPATPGVTLDKCARHHGLWFDAGELPALLGFCPQHPGARQVIDALQELFGTANRT